MLKFQCSEVGGPISESLSAPIRAIRGSLSCAPTGRMVLCDFYPISIPFLSHFYPVSIPFLSRFYPVSILFLSQSYIDFARVSLKHRPFSAEIRKTARRKKIYYNQGENRLNANNHLSTLIRSDQCRSAVISVPQPELEPNQHAG